MWRFFYLSAKVRINQYFKMIKLTFLFIYLLLGPLWTSLLNLVTSPWVRERVHGESVVGSFNAVNSKVTGVFGTRGKRKESY